MLEFIHLFVYPAATGILFFLLIVNIVNRERWLLLTAPAFIAMSMLALTTHVNYLNLLP